MAKGKRVAREKNMTTEITFFTPALRDTPGWNELTLEKQDEMLEITSKLEHYKHMEGGAVIGQCIALENARQALVGQPMGIHAYVKNRYTRSWRTAYRRLQDFGEWKKYWPEPYIRALAENESVWLRGAAGTGMKELIKLAQRLQPPRSKEPKVIEGFFKDRVRGELRAGREARSKREAELLDTNFALREALGGALKIMRRTKFRSAEQQRIWLASLAGMLMQSRDIPGTINVGRLPIPDGFVVKRGPKPRRGRKPKQGIKVVTRHSN